MEVLQTIITAVITISIVVTIHEFGHFWVARRCGVRVLRFSVGFGKPLWAWRGKTGTEYVVAAIPLGGYVKMLDEREGEVAAQDLPYAFTRKPLWQRMAIVAAGPFANFVLAIAAYWLVFATGVSGVAPVIDKVEAGSIAETAGLAPGQEIVAIDGESTPTWQALRLRLLERIGESGTISFSVRQPESEIVYESRAELDDWLVGQEEPDLIGGLGLELYTPPVAPVVEEVLSESPAAEAGLQSGDRVLSADGQPMATWSDWVDYVRARPGERIELTLERDGSEIGTSIVPARKVDEQGEAYGQVGVSVRLPEWPEAMQREFSYSLPGALGAAAERTGQMVAFSLESIKKMLMGLISPKNLSGPITIAKVATASAKSGLEAYVEFLALLSVSLGVINLLPIPVLDGGHLLYGLIEAVTRRPVPERVQVIGFQLGLLIIVGVMAMAIYFDLARL